MNEPQVQVETELAAEFPEEQVSLDEIDFTCPKGHDLVMTDLAKEGSVRRVSLSCGSCGSGFPAVTVIVPTPESPLETEVHGVKHETELEPDDGVPLAEVGVALEVAGTLIWMVRKEKQVEGHETLYRFGRLDGEPVVVLTVPHRPTAAGE